MSARTVVRSGFACGAGNGLLPIISMVQSSRIRGLRIDVMLCVILMVKVFSF